MNGPQNLWLMRKQFAAQTATTMFLTFVCCLSNRTPSRFYISRKTGLMYMSEILPGTIFSCPSNCLRMLILSCSFRPRTTTH